MNIFGWNISRETKDKSENKTRQSSNNTAVVDYTESIVVNSTVTKGLYYNSLNGYKLAGALAYNMIAVPVSFCGFPIPVVGNEEKQKELKEVMKSFNQDFIKILRQSHREGTIWIYPWYDSSINKVRLKFIEDDWVDKIFRDPETGDINSIIVKKNINVLNNQGYSVSVVQTVTYTRSKIITKYDSTSYPGLKNKTQRNVLGILPIAFANMTDGDEIRGHSDYARSLPDLKDYHRISLSMSVDLNDFRTKLIQSAEDPETWACNQGYDSLQDFIDNAEPNKVQFILNQLDETTSIVTNKGMVDGYLSALKNSYKKIVESCGVPELFWGLKQEGNHATAEEAMTTLINYVKGKRDQSTDNFEILIFSIMQLNYMARGTIYTEQLSISWDELDAVSDVSRSEIFKNFCDGISQVMQSQVLTIDQAYKLWKESYPNATSMSKEDFEKGLIKSTTLLRSKNMDTLGENVLTKDEL